MLDTLQIKNFALIDSCSIDFSEGFTVLTGETGAGKSILLGALGMLMGGKVESKYFKDAEKKLLQNTILQSITKNLKQILEVIKDMLEI